MQKCFRACCDPGRETRHGTLTDVERVSRVQSGVYTYAVPGVIMVAEDAMEAVIVFMYIKGLRHKDIVTFRGFMFAQARPWACHVRSYGIARRRSSVCF